MSAPPLPSKKSGGFLKRFSIGGSGSKNSSFSSAAQPVQSASSPDADDAQKQSLPLEGLFDVNDSAFDSRRMLDRMLRSSHSDRDDQSEVSSASAQKKNGSFRKIFRRNSTKKQVVATFSVLEEFTRLRDNWSSQCASSGHTLSNSAIAELNKRIGAALSAADKKTKLNLAKCDLDDTQLALLVRELAVRPILSKLELDNNRISSQGAECLRRLMLSQLELGEGMDANLRVNAVFLGEVSLMKSKLTISLEIAEEINAISVALARLNALNAVAFAYSEKGSPIVLDSKSFSEIWLEVTGKSLDKRTLQSFQKSGSGDGGSGECVWSYTEMESLVEEGLVKLGLLHKLSTKQEDIVNARRGEFNTLHSFSPLNGVDIGRKDSNDEYEQDATPPAHCRSSWQNSQNYPLSYGSEPQTQSFGIADNSHSEYDSEGYQIDDVKLISCSSFVKTKSHEDPSQSSVLTGNLSYEEEHKASILTPQEQTDRISSPEHQSTDHEAPSSLTRHSTSTTVASVKPTPHSPKSAPSSVANSPPEPSFRGVDGKEVPEKNLRSWNADKKIPTSIVVTSPTAQNLLSGGREPPNGWTPTSPTLSDYFPGEDNMIHDENDQLREEISPSTSTNSSPRGANILSLGRNSAYDLNEATQQVKEWSEKAPQFLHQNAGNHSKSQLSPHQQIKSETTKSEICLEEQTPSISQLSPGGKIYTTSEPAAVRSSFATSASPEPDRTHPYRGDLSCNDNAPAEGQLGGRSTPPEPDMENLNIPVLVSDSPEATETIFTSSDGSQGKDGFSCPPLSEGKARSLQRGDSVELSVVVQPPPESNDIRGDFPSDDRFAIDLSDEDLELSSFQEYKSKSNAPVASYSEVAERPEISAEKSLQAQPEQAPVECTLNQVNNQSKHCTVAATGLPSKQDEKNISSQLSVIFTSTAESTHYLHCIDHDSHALSATPTAAANVSTHEETEQNETTHSADNRLFVVQGIRRKKFTSSDISLLCYLPQLFHITELESGEKYTIGKELTQSAVSKQSSFFTQTEGSEYFRFNSTTVTSVELSQVLDGSDSSNLIRSADLAGCKVPHLSELRLGSCFPLLLELNLCKCELNGRFPASALPRSLIRLDLSQNRIVDFSGVMSCPHIQELNLGFNMIETVHVIPQSLIRLNLERNLIWNKVCLRIIALSPQLQSVCLDGNPVTALVAGWAAMLRSMSTKLHYLDGRRIEPRLQDIKKQLLSTPIQAKLSSPLKSRLGIPTPINQKKAVIISAQEQRLRDEERAQQYQEHLMFLDQKRESYIDRIEMNALSVKKPEKVLLEASIRLSSPKYMTSKPIQKKKKVAGANPPTSFGTSKRDFYGVIGVQSNHQAPVTAASNSSSRQHSHKTSSARSAPSMKWSKFAAVQAIDVWTEKVAQCLDDAAVLINRVDLEVAQQSRPVIQEDVQAFQRSLIDIKISDCDPLPFPVKLALNTLHADANLVSTISSLHEKLKNYATVLYRLEGALSLCAASSKSFGVSFRIIMNSETGLLLNDVPKIDAISAQNVVARTKERISSLSPPTSVRAPDSSSVSRSYHKNNTTLDEDAAVGENCLEDKAASSIQPQCVVRAPPHSPVAATSTIPFRMHNNDAENVQTYIQQWKVDSAKHMSMCSELLKSITDRFTRSSITKIPDSRSQQDLSLYLKELQSHIQCLELAQYDTVPAEIENACVSQPELRDALAALRSFKGLFAQIENMLYLCNKGGIEFEPALQVLMNSSVGRAVKNALLGAKSLTILTPRLSSPVRNSSPGKILPAFAGSAVDNVSQAIVVEAQKVEQTNATALEEKNSAIDLLNENVVADESDVLNESVDQLEFAVVIDPNVETVQTWLNRCECVLGRAAISMNSVIDLAHSSHAPTTKMLCSLREEHASIGISSCEPPPKAVNAALQALGRDHPLFAVAWETRTKLDAYDDIFSQVENALAMCLEYQQDFQYAFDLLMRTEAGIKANRYMHGIYSYSSSYD